MNNFFVKDSMKFQRFNKTYIKSCIGIFDSNLDIYFDQSERAEFIDFLESLKKSDQYYVYIEASKIKACGGISFKNGIGSLCWGIVHKDFHNRGIGKELSQYRLNLLSSISDLTIIKIETSQHTEGFYRKQGFIATNRKKNGFGIGIDCIEMEKKP